MAAVTLKGITWNHTRGLLPMAATAQRFEELHPEVRIVWDKRSLRDFGDASLVDLAKTYDLLVIDHPFVGTAAANNVLLPLETLLRASFLEEQAAASVGRSHESYFYGGHQWALAIDAATPVSGWRPDLLQSAGWTLPRTWDEVLELARRGLVVFPAVPTDSLMHIYMLCGALGEDPFQLSGRFVSEDIGVAALEAFRQLVGYCDARVLTMNPIAVWESLSKENTAAYCPFAYGYSVYSKAGYADHMLQVGPLVEYSPGVRLKSTLGGAGLAVASRCAHTSIAIRYAEYVASPLCQRSLYAESGGQPGYGGAWVDAEVNRRSNDFYRATLSTLDEAYLRPRFDGYSPLQEELGHIVHSFLKTGCSTRETLKSMNELCHASASW